MALRSIVIVTTDGTVGIIITVEATIPKIITGAIIDMISVTIGGTCMMCARDRTLNGTFMSRGFLKERSTRKVTPNLYTMI